LWLPDLSGNYKSLVLCIKGDNSFFHYAQEKYRLCRGVHSSLPGRHTFNLDYSAVHGDSEKEHLGVQTSVSILL